MLVLMTWANEASSPMPHLTYTEVCALADFALSRQQPLVARGLIEQWRDGSDEADWQDANEDGDADAWLALTEND